MRTIAILLGLLFWCGSPVPRAAAAPASAPRKPPDSVWFTHYDARTFRQLAAAGRAIHPQRIEPVLLDAAVFHETNRRRQLQGLPPLAYDEKARETARIHSRAMAEHQFVGHTNSFDASKRTVTDRVRLTGLRASVLAENVASTFGRNYKAEEKVFVREENGQKVYSYQPDGPPLVMHTYLSFAETIVNAWMKSPGHRKNILHPSLQYLGCACEPAKEESAMQTIYCVQVFFAPVTDPR